MTIQKPASRAGVILMLSVLIVPIGLVGAMAPAAAQSNGLETEVLSYSLAEILPRIEARYAGGGFSARFFQQSTLVDMDMTDTAEGHMMAKKPGKMRWVYTAPDRQIIVTDGISLWIYRPEDNQVMVGGFPELFGDGKGASFLSDMTLLNKQFDIALIRQSTQNRLYMLKLTPWQESAEISEIHLGVARDSFEVVTITTITHYGDQTVIRLKDIEFEDRIPDTVFQFVIPPGADVVDLD